MTTRSSLRRDDATIGVDANLALDPVVIDRDHLADRRLAGLWRIQPFGVGYGFDKCLRVAGIGVATARDLLAETSLDRC
jgi:hypothetical protein